jgi:O-methyltransferase involved in polyketide biosynthesis
MSIKLARAPVPEAVREAIGRGQCRGGFERTIESMERSGISETGRASRTAMIAACGEGSIAEKLERAGIGSGATFVSWLGVTPYLSLDAIGATLRGLPPGSLAIPYSAPEDTWPAEVRAVSKTFGAIAVEAGEPPVSRFTPDRFASVLADRRFGVVGDVGFDDVEPRYGLPALSVGSERIALAKKEARLLVTTQRRSERRGRRDLV